MSKLEVVLVETMPHTPFAPWRALYPPDVAADLNAEFETPLALFRACVAERPDHPGFWYFGRELTYRELDSASDALAAWLEDHGATRGDRIAVILQNGPEFLITMVAAWKTGAIPMPANPMYRASELAKLFADAEPEAIVCEHGHRREIERAYAALAAPPPPLLTTSPEAYRPERAAQAPDDGSVRGAIAAYGGRRPAAQPLEPDDLGLLLYTSGTTGEPKGAMLRHRSLAFNAQTIRDWCALGPQSRVLAIAPLFHITGVVCHLLAAMSARATVIAHYRFEPRLVLATIRQTRPTFTIGAITAFNALLNEPGAVPADFTSFERVYSGGAPIPPALVEALKARLGIVVHSSYGMTETTAPTHLAPFRRTIPVDPVSGALSIGVPSPSTEAIVAGENGRELAVGQIGEILVRGPQIMAGYWRKPKDTASALAGGWMHTGDVGFRDEAGWFYLVDRKKDVIIASGFKVWPREVEDVLYAHPAVREAAVVGVPDSYRGETVKAYVSLKTDSRAEEGELIAYCRGALAAYKAPRSIEVLPELPKTLTGKIQRAALRERG